jgi:hypothetical protein
MFRERAAKPFNSYRHSVCTPPQAWCSIEILQRDIYCVLFGSACNLRGAQQDSWIYIMQLNVSQWKSATSCRPLRSSWPINFYCIRKMTVTVFTKKMRAINGEGDKNRKVCGATNPLYNRPPPQKKRSNLALGVNRSNYYNTWYILSMLIGWKSGTSTCRKLSVNRIQQQNIPNSNYRFTQFLWQFLATFDRRVRLKPRYW